jgi:hypothetical protein
MRGDDSLSRAAIIDLTDDEKVSPLAWPVLHPAVIIAPNATPLPATLGDRRATGEVAKKPLKTGFGRLRFS